MRGPRHPGTVIGAWAVGLVRFVGGVALGLALVTALPCSTSWADPEGTPAATEPVLFYFFSPDWRPADLGRLAEGMDGVFASAGLAITFQAFARYEDFARQLSVEPPHFLMAPAWMSAPDADSPAAGLGLEVLARPRRHGRSAYRKALMTRPGTDSIDDLARGAIAATVHSMGAGSESAVLEAFHLAPDSAKVVAVPKDVDALLALSFGQVDAALVTSHQYEELAATNPVEAESMRVLAFSPEIGLPPVYARGAGDERLRASLLDVLKTLQDSGEGRTVLDLLGFDALVPEAAAAAGSRPGSRDRGRDPAVAR